MLPDTSTMDAQTCLALAQVVPVLFLTLLFEIRVRPSARRSPAGLVLGLLGNLVVAAAAITLEFGLLGAAQHSKVVDAQWLWFVAFALFLLVLVRWVATTTVAKFLAAQSADFRAAVATEVLDIAKSSTSIGVDAVIAVIAPSQVLVGVVSALGPVFASLGSVLLGMGRNFAQIFTELLRGIFPRK